ncbi:FAD-binding protein [Salinibacterium sp. dk2585]|nr:FAD-binding protein [Salinibacterium sp. dk2585]TXK54835.1 FAD-binding protein [Salinibacterium sp. dk5596]
MLPGRRWRNWGRSASASPAFLARPRSVEELVATVGFARDRNLAVTSVGSGHSFSAIAAAPGVQVDVSALSGLYEVDAATARARVGAGTRLHDLAELLAPHGLALENMGDIDRQTVAGAISTGTHGTGIRFGGLAARIVGVTLVTAEGDVLSVDESSELLPAVRLGLGALGVLVDVTIQCVPAFLLHAVERPERLEVVLENLVDRMRGADHFEFYWFPHTRAVLTKTNTRLPADAASAPLSSLSRWVDESLLSNGVFQVTCSLGRVVPAAIPSVNRLATKLIGDREFTDASHRVFATQRAVRFREMEYSVPVEALPSALRQVRALIEARGWRISFPLEVRATAPDDSLLSTSHGRESGYIAVHRYFRDDHREYFASVESILSAHDGRPHWGKMHTQDAAALEPRYERFAEFLAIRDRLDPSRTFTNAYIRRVLGP